MCRQNLFQNFITENLHFNYQIFLNFIKNSFAQIYAKMPRKIFEMNNVVVNRAQFDCREYTVGVFYQQGAVFDTEF